MTEDALRALGIMDTSALARWVFASLNGIVLQQMAGVPTTRLREGLIDLQNELQARAMIAGG